MKKGHRGRDIVRPKKHAFHPLLSLFRSWVFVPFCFCLLIFLLPQKSWASALVFPQVGFNTHSVTNDPTDLEISPNPGFQVGLNFRLGSESLFFQPGVFWNHYSLDQNFTDQLSGSLTTQQSGVNSLQFPALVGAIIFKNKTFELDLNGGVVLDLVTGRVDIAGTPPDALKSATWSGRIGIEVGFSRVMVGFSYDIGISKLFKNHVGSAYKVNSLNGNLGIKFAI